MARIQDRIKSQPPATCVFQEPDLIERTVRDFLTEDVERIVVDSQKAYDRMREMISKISKRSANKVKLYTDPQPIFDRFNITRQLENAFSRQVHLKSGGYIVVDETEALVAIDVNTGRHKGGKDQESTILKVNLEAADEISPPVAPAQHGRVDRARFHRHEIAARPAAGLSADEGGSAPRQGQNSCAADLATRPDGNDAPTPFRKRARGGL